MVVVAGRGAALGQVHAALAVEGDRRDLDAVLERRHLDFDARAAGHGAVRVDADRPDLRPLRDRIEQAAIVDGEREDAPRRRREAPGRRAGGVEGRAGDIDRRHRRQRERRQAGVRPAFDAVVVGALLRAVEAVAVDDAGRPFGGEDLPGGRVVGEAAERGGAGRRAGDRGEQRHFAGGPVDAPDGAGTAAVVRRAELAGHELGAGLAALRRASSGRCRRRRRSTGRRPRSPPDRCWDARRRRGRRRKPGRPDRASR